MRKYPWVIILATPKKRRKWIAFALLFIVALISLLVVFELTGILKESPTPEIIVVDTVSLNITKPQETQSIWEFIESRYEDGNADVWVSSVISIATYHVDHFSAVGVDMLMFGINGSANANFGYIQSIEINFSRTDNDSYVDPIGDWDYLAQAENLNVWRFDSGATSTNEAKIMAKGINQPKFAYLRIVNQWVFYKKEASHLITVTVETTFFNGTAYVKTVMPIRLEVFAS